MTRLEIRTMARKRLGETTGAFWTDAELNTWINEAGEDCAFKSKSIRDNYYFNTVVDQLEYSLSTVLPLASSILDLYVKISGTTWRRMLPLANREEFDAEYEGWMNASAAAPYRYYWDREEDKLYLYPKPDATSAGTNYARAYCTKKFTLITNDASTPDLPDPLHLAMVDWVVALGYETRGYGDKANDAYAKYGARITSYRVERHREKEDDEIIMRPQRWR